MKRISIIIPVYNAEKFIRECLESIYKQRMNENTFEVIIVNDGSKDQSMEMIKELTKTHCNLKIINQSNSGVSIARNNGLQIADGNYIWFIDADDILTDNCLKEIIDVSERNDLDILKIAHMQLKDSAKDKLGAFVIPSLHSYLCKSGQEGFIENFNPNEGYVWQYIFKRNFLTEYNLQFLEHIIFCEDWFFSISALLTAKKFMSIPLQAYIYRQHEASAIHTLSREAMLSLNIITEQTVMLSKKKQLNFNSKEKLKSCIFHLLTLNFWLLAHTPALHSSYHEIINDLKKRIPHFKLNRTFHERRFSFYYNYCPYFYIGLRSFINKQRLQISIVKNQPAP